MSFGQSDAHRPAPHRLPTFSGGSLFAVGRAKRPGGGALLVVLRAAPGAGPGGPAPEAGLLGVGALGVSGVSGGVWRDPAIRLGFVSCLVICLVVGWLFRRFFGGFSGWVSEFNPRVGHF